MECETGSREGIIIMLYDDYLPITENECGVLLDTMIMSVATGMWYGYDIWCEKETGHKGLHNSLSHQATWGNSACKKVGKSEL